MTMDPKGKGKKAQNEQQDTQGQQGQQTTETAANPPAATETAAPATAPARKPRTRDTRLDARDAIVAAWKGAGNKGVPEDVKKADFKRIAQRRLDDALDGLRKLAHCGNRNNYSYTTEQAAALMAALSNAVADVERAFEPKGESAHRVEL
jgi:hypothetical protein